MGENLLYNCKVSVIVPLYNQEKYIKRCILSICKQSYNNIEVIIVNDGSTDKSLEIVEKICKQDSRVIVHNQINSGVSIARKTGIQKASGKYIIFVDSDDYLLPNAIIRLLSTIERTNTSMVICSHKRAYGPFLKTRHYNLPKNHIIYHNELMNKYYISFFGCNILPVQMWGRIYRKEIIDKALHEVPLFIDQISHMGEDELFNVLLHPYLKSIYIIDDPYYVYRYGGITCHYNKFLSELFNFSDIRINLLDKYQYTEGYNFLFVEYKNILNSEICQQIIYNNASYEDCIRYIENEINQRYLVMRMREYIRTHVVNSSLLPIIHSDCNKILNNAYSTIKTNKKRILIKHILHYITQK